MAKIAGTILLSENQKEYYAGTGDFSPLPVQRIFTRLTDQSTSGTTAETLWSNTLPAGRLSGGGQMLRLIYAGTFAANSNQKLLWLELFGTSIDGFETAQSGGAWRIEAEVMRVSSSAVRVSALYVFGASLLTEYREITGLNFSSSQSLNLAGRTPSNAGDLTAHMGACEWRDI
jgi:hypothetical protein